MSIKITEQNFETEVLQSAMPVVVDFWADWCGPCKMMGPVLEELAAAHPTVKVGKLNTDENLKLAMARKIDAIPALLLFKDGREVSPPSSWRRGCGKTGRFDLLGFCSFFTKKEPKKFQ